MEELKLAFETLGIWLLLCSFTVLMAYSFYLFLELWEMDRKNLLILIAVYLGATVTGIIWAMLQ